MNKFLTQCISDAFICTKGAEIMNLYSEVTGQTYRHMQLDNWVTGQTYRHMQLDNWVTGQTYRHMQLDN